MYDLYGSQGFLPIAVNLWQDMETVVKVYARQYTYPFLRDAGTAWNAYRMTGSIPLNYAIDTAGLVINSMQGYSFPTVESWITPYLTGVEEAPTATSFEFATVGANPVVGHSTVRFSLPRAANVSLRVYSTSGALVRTLYTGQMPEGVNTVNWNLHDNAGRPVGNGLYLFELVSGSQTAHTKVSVLK